MVTILRNISNSSNFFFQVRVVSDENTLFGPVNLGQLFKLGFSDDSRKNLTICFELSMLSKFTDCPVIVEADLPSGPIEGSPMALSR